MAGSILGTRVTRKEDPRFITTGGIYVDDLAGTPGTEALDGAAHVVYARSPMAHATISSIDTSEAAAMPGVLGVFTGDGLDLQPRPSQYNPGATRTLLARDRVRYVGEPVAAVVAETLAQATDAAEAVLVDYEPLDAVVDLEAALDAGTLLHPEVGSNIVGDSTALGMPDLTGDDFFASCEVVVDGRLVNQRIAACPLEPRASAAAWVTDDGGGLRLHQWLSTQHAHGARDSIATANGVGTAAVRVITPDVGGGFGAKIGSYPEELLLGRLAAEVGRPVRWAETRSESMMNMHQGRAQIHHVTVGGTRDGRITHYRLHVIQDSGAYADVGTVLAPFMTRPMSPGVYDIANVECRTQSVVTNTTPTGAFRGAGRPEATAAIERTVDLFAAELGMDPVEVRRINLVAPFSEPHTTPTDVTYDVGNYGGALDRVVEAARYEELRAEQRRRRDAGETVQLGIGVSVYVEITAGLPPFHETASIEVDGDGRAVVYTGSSSHGQGHETAFSMLASERTGIPMDRITVVWGDTDQVADGQGTMASRSLQMGGSAVNQAAIELVELAKSRAANRLEASAADVVLDTDQGVFHVTGTPAVSVSWAELAGDSEGSGEPLRVDTLFETSQASFPFGAHVAVVEVDTDTGQVRLVRHVACDDAGRILNPLLLEGQLHGGIGAGAAQALIEEVRYDSDGNPITSNLADYGMISAPELPSFELVPMETPTFLNPLGAKGVGESGTIGSTPAVQNAVVDALAHLGVRHVDMPATAERVWRAIEQARST